MAKKALLYLKTFKTPPRKQLSLGVLRQRHSKNCKVSEYSADTSKSKPSKQKTGNKSSKALRYLQNQTFYYESESNPALVTKRSRTNKNQTISTTFICKFSRTKTSKSKTVRKKVLDFVQRCRHYRFIFQYVHCTNN